MADIPTNIGYAEISQYLAANDSQKQSYFLNTSLVKTTPRLIYIVRKAIQFQYNNYPTSTSFSLVVYSDVIEARQINNLRLHFCPPRLYTENLTRSWVSGGSYMYNIIHNLNTLYPIVQIWAGNKLKTDDLIECYTVSTSAVTLSAAVNQSSNLHITIIGND